MESQRPHPIPCADSPSPAAQLGSDTGSELIAGCTLKALIVGLLAVLCLAFGSPYNDMIVQGHAAGPLELHPGGDLPLLRPRSAAQHDCGSHPTPLGAPARRAGRGLLPPGPGQHYGGRIRRLCPAGERGGLLLRTPENNWHEIVHPICPTGSRRRIQKSSGASLKATPPECRGKPGHSSALLADLCPGDVPDHVLPDGRRAAAVGGARAPALSDGPVAAGHDRRRRSRPPRPPPLSQPLHVGGICLPFILDR